jgi:hypothetical protein
VLSQEKGTRTEAEVRLQSDRSLPSGLLLL